MTTRIYGASDAIPSPGETWALGAARRLVARVDQHHKTGEPMVEWSSGSLSGQCTLASWVAGGWQKVAP